MSTKSAIDSDMPVEKKRKLGRPKMSQELEERFQIRCSKKDIEMWTERAVEMGYGSVGAWIRHTANVALKQPAR